MSRLIVVTGGSASGKSAHAERILCTLAPRSRLYLATMQPFGAEAQARIARHRTMRADKGFETLERTHDLAHLQISTDYDGILLEDVGNLLANELYAPGGAGEHAVSAACAGIAHLAAQCGTLVAVTNEVFSDGLRYDDETVRYIRALGQLNTALAAHADAVYESVCGILIAHEGEKFC